jgi:hypothetical protein
MAGWTMAGGDRRCALEALGNDKRRLKGSLRGVLGVVKEAPIN